jgi:hypothetical protein
MHGDSRSRAPATPTSPVSSSSSSSAYVNDALQRRNHSAGLVAVVGAGFLGRCIALDLSLLGLRVLVCDADPHAATAVRIPYLLQTLQLPYRSLLAEIPVLFIVLFW